MKQSQAYAFACVLMLGCHHDVGSIDVRLVWSPLSQDDPLDERLVKTVRVSVEGPDGLLVPSATADLAQQSISVPDVPTGDTRIITIEGLGGLDNVVSRGRSRPQHISEGTNLFELFIGRTDTFSQTPVSRDGKQRGMSQARAFHTSTPLGNGSVLLAGGVITPWRPTNRLPAAESITDTVEVLDSDSLRFSSVNCSDKGACMGQARLGHSATLLPQGDVLIAGGLTSPDDNATLTSSETYDPGEDLSGRFFDGPQLLTPHMFHAVGIQGNDVVLAGGANASLAVTPSVEAFFDQGSLRRLPQLRTARRNAAMVSLPDGTLVVIGGLDNQGEPLSSTEQLRPGAGRWSLGANLGSSRVFHTATLAADGSIIIIGGLSDGNNAVASIERLTPDGKLSVIGTLERPRWAHTTTLLPDGRLLVVGGFSLNANGSPTNSYEEVIIGESGLATVRFRCCLRQGRGGHSATLLRSGWVLIAGGVTESQEGVSLADTAEAYVY